MNDWPLRTDSSSTRSMKNSRMNSSSRLRKPIFSWSSLLFSMLSVNRSMLNTMSRFGARAHARMFFASSMLVAKIVAGGPLAARDVQVLDRAPELVRQHRIELVERHVRLAVAVLPVVAHLAAGIADPRAVIDEDRRTNGMDRRRDERIGQIPGNA